MAFGCCTRQMNARLCALISWSVLTLSMLVLNSKVVKLGAIEQHICYSERLDWVTATTSLFLTLASVLIRLSHEDIALYTFFGTSALGDF